MSAQVIALTLAALVAALLKLVGTPVTKNPYFLMGVSLVLSVAAELVTGGLVLNFANPPALLAAIMANLTLVFTLASVVYATFVAPTSVVRRLFK
jgi:hypothetical protein